MSGNELSNQCTEKQHQLSGTLRKKKALYQVPVKTFQKGKIHLLTTKEQLCLHNFQLFVAIKQLDYFKKELQDLI